MKTTKLVIATMAAGLFSTATFALDCTAPNAPTIPEGDNASKSEMTFAKAEFKNYLAESKQYLSCVKDKQMSLAASATKDEREAISDMYDDMANNMESVYDDMSAAAEDFKESAQARLDKADTATQSEQQAVAAMYDDMVSNLKMASNKVKAAFDDFQKDVEEAE